MEEYLISKPGAIVCRKEMLLSLIRDTGTFYYYSVLPFLIAAKVMSASPNIPQEFPVIQDTDIAWCGEEQRLWNQFRTHTLGLPLTSCSSYLVSRSLSFLFCKMGIIIHLIVVIR